MAKTSTIGLSVGISGDGLSQSTYVPPQSPLVNASAPEGIPQVYVLTTGLNTIVAPAGTQYALLVPPATSVVAKTAKTTSGDAGIAFTAGLILMPIAGGASLYVNAAAGEALSVVWA